MKNMFALPNEFYINTPVGKYNLLGNLKRMAYYLSGVLFLFVEFREMNLI